MEHDNEIEAARARVSAGAQRSATGGIEVTDPDPDRWARDWIAVLNAKRNRGTR